MLFGLLVCCFFSLAVSLLIIFLVLLFFFCNVVQGSFFYFTFYFSMLNTDNKTEKILLDVLCSFCCPTIHMFVLLQFNFLLLPKLETLTMATNFFVSLYHLSHFFSLLYTKIKNDERFIFAIFVLSTYTLLILPSSADFFLSLLTC